MDRPQRIRMVIALAVSLFSFMAAIAGPVIVFAALSPKLGNIAKPQEAMGNYLLGLEQVTNLAELVGCIALGISGTALLYALVSLASWFIGPSRRKSPQEVRGSSMHTGG